MSHHRAVGLIAAAVFVFSACGPGATATPTTAPTAAATTPAATTTACTVGVSWNNFQQRRWAATDKPNMQQVIEAGGGTFIDKDANLDTQQQITDVNTLIEQGANVLIILAQDLSAIGPAVQAAKDHSIPVIAYDRLIDDPYALYITFDNVGVGEAEAAAVLAKVPTGTYVLIKGDPGDPNAATFLPQGWNNAGLQAKIDSGDITVFAEQFTDAWDTTTAQNNMEAIIDNANSQSVQIDAILAENDSTALGVAAALQAKNYGIVPFSGQDGDPANLNNVAKGIQYVDVWKNSNELGKVAGAAALQLCAGTTIDQVTIPDGLIDPSVAPAAGPTATDFPGTPSGTAVKSLILKPTPITAENLNLVVDGGWITKEDLCKDVDPSTAPAACQ